MGANDYGQCGVGLIADIVKPTFININDAILSVKCGDLHTIIKSESNEYYSFGNNNKGQCLIKNQKGKIYVPTLINIDELKQRLKYNYNILNIIPGSSQTFIIQDIQ